MPEANAQSQEFLDFYDLPPWTYLSQQLRMDCSYIVYIVRVIPILICVTVSRNSVKPERVYQRGYQGDSPVQNFGLDIRCSRRVAPQTDRDERLGCRTSLRDESLSRRDSPEAWGYNPSTITVHQPLLSSHEIPTLAFFNSKIQ